MNIAEVTNAQSAIYFVGHYVGLRNSENRLTSPILKKLFEEHIPSYPHILSALIRSSGRPPSNAWTKQQAIDYFVSVEANLKSAGVEELLLYAVLMRYQKMSEPVTESSMAKAVSRVMLERNCTAAAAAQYLERNWGLDVEGKGVKANYLLIQYQRHFDRRNKT